MYHQWRIKLAFTHSQKYSRILDWLSFGRRWDRPNMLAIHLSALIKLKAISRVFAEPLYSGNVCKNPRVRDLLSEWPHDNTTMQSIPTHRGKCIKVFRCFCLILKVWIIASICYSEQAALHDAGSRSSFIVTNLWQPKILFILLQFASYAEYNNAMLPRPQGGDYEFKLAFEMIPRWEGGEDNQNIFWCELPTGIWHWHPGWQNENRNLMRGNQGNGVTDNPKSSYTQCFHLLCNLQQYFVKSFCYVYDAGNWSQKCQFGKTVQDFTF